MFSMKIRQQMEPTGKNSGGTFIQIKIYESTNRDNNGFRGGCLAVEKKKIKQLSKSVCLFFKITPMFHGKKDEVQINVWCYCTSSWFWIVSVLRQKIWKTFWRSRQECLQGIKSPESIKEVLHKVLLLFDHFGCAMSQKVTAAMGTVVRETWLKHPRHKSKIKILNTMNSHYSEHKFINGQSSQKVLLEMLFHRHHGSRNWQKTKLNISFPLSGDAAMISENQNWYVGLWIIFICIRNNAAWWRTPKPPHFSKNVFGSFPAYAVLLPFWE